MNRFTFDLQSLIYKTGIITREPVCRRHYRIIDSSPTDWFINENKLLLSHRHNPLHYLKKLRKNITLFEGEALNSLDKEHVETRHGLISLLQNGYTYISKILIYQGVPLLLERSGDSGNFTLHEVVRCWSKRENYESIKLVLEMSKDGEYINVFNYYEDNALMTYVSYNSNVNIKTIKLLHQYGFDLNHKNTENGTVLMYAAQKGNIEIVKYLIDNGADIYAKDYKGDQAWKYAAKSNNREMVKYIFQLMDDREEE